MLVLLIFTSNIAFAATVPLIKDFKVNKGVSFDQSKVEFQFNLTKKAKITINILSGNKIIRVLTNKKTVPAGKVVVYWAKTNSKGVKVAPGTYGIQIIAEASGKKEIKKYSLKLYGPAKPPVILDYTLSPQEFTAEEPLILYFNLNQAAKVEFLVLNDQGTVVHRYTTPSVLSKGLNYFIWDGTGNVSGKELPAGEYTLKVTPIDQSGLKGATLSILIKKK
ncbi:hypothetical protein ciss_11170 [Carboxydothermus islandicus]|uniref:FlgD/Vpr Ig-like domain-containing protein n=1 Tax=Carboxydothermus islandicus TaxID=661089 RepID=A0A1L8D245_9THEO|nr:hypothetical protein ciss_11170 [Carboxydothermus islandicus]